MRGKKSFGCLIIETSLYLLGAEISFLISSLPPIYLPAVSFEVCYRDSGSGKEM